MSLSFEAPQDVNDKNSYVGDAAASPAEIRESLMSWGVNDEQPWDLYFTFDPRKQRTHQLIKRFDWEITRADVLRDPPNFPSLNAGLADFVQKRSLATINMTENAHNWLTSWHLTFLLAKLNKPIIHRSI
jgi:hypothetical protein